MSDLPDGWAWTTLGEIADTTLGKMLDRGKSNGHFEVPYLRNVNVQWGRIDTDDLLTMELPPDQLDFFSLDRGDLLVCEGGEIGRCAIWPGFEQYVTFQKALHRVRPLQGISSDFLQLVLHWMHDTNQLSAYSTGSTIKHLPQTSLRRLKIPLPPLAEQREIVSIVKENLSSLDAADSAVEKIRTRASELRRSLVVSRLYDNQERYNDYRRLGDIAELASGSTPSQLASLPVSLGDTTVPFYKVGDMNDSSGRYMGASRLNFDSALLERSGVRVRPPGTILLPKRGGAIATNKKRILRRSAGYDLNTMGLVPKDSVDSVYLWYWLQTVDLARIADGSNVPQINNPHLKPLLVPVPTLERQAVIVAELDDLHLNLDRIMTDLPLDRSNELRRTVLTEALNGRLVPQNPDDEPASVLIDQIRSERAATEGGRPRRRSTTGRGLKP